MKTTLRKLHNDESGAALIEFAFVFPVFCMMLLGFADYGMGFAAKLKTQQAAARTMERVAMGSGELTEINAMLKSEAATAANVSQDKVAVDVWLECNGTRQASVEGACAAGQETARFASVVIRNEYRPIFGALTPAASQANGTIPFRGKSSVRLQ